MQGRSAGRLRFDRVRLVGQPLTVQTREEARGGTLFVLEELPSPGRRRWFCHLDGLDAPSFDDVGAAIEWGLVHAHGVVVRTLSSEFYLLGDPPRDWGEGIDLHEWPPEGGAARIDADFRRESERAAEEERLWALHEYRRDEWVSMNIPSRSGVSFHERFVAIPASDQVVVLEAIDVEGDVWSAYCEGRSAFGSATSVLEIAAGRPGPAGWSAAVVRALDHDRLWQERRDSLEVRQAEGEMFHVTASANRESILSHGLDWRRMGASTGIAGSPTPEVPGVFLCETLSETPFYTQMSRVTCDVWAANVSGRWIESGPSGWWVLPEPIPPSELRLVERDIAPTRW